MVILAVLAGCADEEFEMAREEAESNARFTRACYPLGGEFVTAKWENGQLVCRRYLQMPRSLNMTASVVEEK